ncbi:unnamed protein product [Symbiodinium natans]|uniref:Uncharacterized protein n=1 Tax=Symbiodinium natans TaxID=878477 RepID=A0A812Q666_9DINO|nr:unnamed protein product [Symbiodinium natans]
MFWLGLTKSRTASMETLRMGFGSLQIENSTLLVLGDHVEVQMRLVEGLRHLVRRESAEHMCEYISGMLSLIRVVATVTAADPREAAAIESKKFSFNGFLSLICRCTTSWVLHRVLLLAWCFIKLYSPFLQAVKRVLQFCHLFELQDAPGRI